MTFNRVQLDLFVKLVTHPFHFIIKAFNCYVR